jgi:HNH endonuclease
MVRSAFLQKRRAASPATPRSWSFMKTPTGRSRMWGAGRARFLQRFDEALTARDRRCLFPGCNVRRCDAHHIDHWADGGPTALDNLMLVCRRHHRLLHEGGFSVERTEAADVLFRRPDGRLVEVSPSTAWTGAGVVPAGVTGRSLRVWDGTPFNVGYAIDVLHPRANPVVSCGECRAPSLDQRTELAKSGDPRARASGI